MKTLLLACLILFFQANCLSQQKENMVVLTDSVEYPFTYVTENRDTLYVADNEMGRMIVKAWKLDTTGYSGKVPVFVWKDEDWITNTCLRKNTIK